MTTRKADQLICNIIDRLGMGNHQMYLYAGVIKLNSVVVQTWQVFAELVTYAYTVYCFYLW